ncbi:nuclear valosin-containing protein-like isoform X1 [Tachysurus ichikawai]
MAATTRPDIIDPAMLRPGRLDKTLYVGFPSPEDRHAILLTITKRGTKPRLHSDVSLEEIAHDERCDCFTGADLSALVREASVNALRAHLYSQTAIPHVGKHTIMPHV